MSFNVSVEVRWSDLDPNFHLRHSVYYDWGAFCRMQFLKEHGLDASVMHSLHIGPVIFREECTFRREILFGDRVRIDVEAVWAKEDFSRWALRHTIYKEEDQVAAVIQLEGAWIDTVKRKLTVPPPIGTEAFAQMPKANDFKLLDS